MLRPRRRRRPSSPTCWRTTRSSRARCCASRTRPSTTAAREVTSLHRAAMVIGMRALKVVALGFTLSSELPQKGVAAGLDLNVYWHRSVVNAVIARALARTVDQPVAEEAFLCGLLSDIGKLALTHAAPERVRRRRRRSGRLAVRRAGARAPRLRRRRGRRAAAARLGRPRDARRSAPRTRSRSEQVSDRRARRGPPPRAASSGSRSSAPPSCSTTTRAPRSCASSSEAERALRPRSRRPSSRCSPRSRTETGEAAQHAVARAARPGVSYHGLVEQARNLMVSMSVEAMMRLDETSRTVAVLERENEDLQAKAHTDGLTGLPNREMLDALPRAAGAAAPARGPARACSA